MISPSSSACLVVINGDQYQNVVITAPTEWQLRSRRPCLRRSTSVCPCTRWFRYGFSVSEFDFSFSKIEIKLKKQDGIRWQTLEREEQQTSVKQFSAGEYLQSFVNTNGQTSHPTPFQRHTVLDSSELSVMKKLSAQYQGRHLILEQSCNALPLEPAEFLFCCSGSEC